jgi:hypothetical protein
MRGPKRVNADEVLDELIQHRVSLRTIQKNGEPYPVVLYDRIEALIQHLGVEVFVISGAVWKDALDEDLLDTSNDLRDCLYERGQILVTQRVTLEDVIHELAHWVCADEDRRARVNYGTGFLDEDTNSEDWWDACTEHEAIACDLEITYLKAVDWPRYENRAIFLNTLEPINEPECYQERLKMWSQVLPEELLCRI